MEKSARGSRNKFDTPDEGVDDWLWYRPLDPEYGSSGGYLRQMICDQCDVRWFQEIVRSQPVRCWSCGKFKRKPKI